MDGEPHLEILKFGRLHLLEVHDANRYYVNFNDLKNCCANFPFFNGHLIHLIVVEFIL